MDSVFVVFFVTIYGGFGVLAFFLAYNRYKDWKMKQDKKNRFKLIDGGKNEQD